VAPGLIVSACALVVATGFGLLWQRRNGRVSAVAEEIGTGELGAVSAGPPGTPLTQDDLRAALGDRATLVQFSSAFCAPCRATRQILTEVAGMVDGVAHVEIDAESRLDLVRRLDVRRTPTTIVLGPDGQITHRASGQPRKADVIAALGAVL
jgi:thiol-disulfide isomerase/thioredoxin